MKTNDKIVQFCSRIDAEGVYHAPEQDEWVFAEESSAPTSAEALAQLRQQMALLLADSTVACRLAQAEREAVNAQLVAADAQVNHTCNVHHDLIRLLDSMNTKEEN